MIEEMADMPEGTVGFVLSGEITPGTYRDVLFPKFRTLIAAGQPLRVLIQIGPEFKEGPATLWQGIKGDWEFEVKDRKAWTRTALVTDKAWMRHAKDAFGWAAPGELESFTPDELDAAKAWVAG